MKVIILAGGMGKRMAEYSDLPKVMIPINKKPLLEWQILQLKKQTFNDVCIIDNKQTHDSIFSHFGYGEKFDINIGYHTESKPLGTAGFLSKTYQLLPPKFMVIFGDLYFDMDLNKFVEAFKKHEDVIMAVIHESDHPQDSSKLEIDFDTAISYHSKIEEYAGNLTTAGIFGIDKRVINRMLRVADLDEDYLQMLIKSRQLKVYLTDEYIKDAGTPDRFFQVESYLKLI